MEVMYIGGKFYPLHEVTLTRDNVNNIVEISATVGSNYMISEAQQYDVVAMTDSSLTRIVSNVYILSQSMEHKSSKLSIEMQGLSVDVR